MLFSRTRGYSPGFYRLGLNPSGLLGMHQTLPFDTYIVAMPNPPAIVSKDKLPRPALIQPPWIANSPSGQLNHQSLRSPAVSMLGESVLKAIPARFPMEILGSLLRPSIPRRLCRLGRNHA